MAKLIYSSLCSLDGYNADAAGSFAWAAPSPEVHQFVNDLQRPVATHLYGRRTYDTMVAWETVDTRAMPPHLVDFQSLWRAADKIVYSRSLTEVRSERTRIEDRFDPVAVRQLKEHATTDLTIAGPELASLAFQAGLIDELQLLLFPVIVGGGSPTLPHGARLDLELIAEHHFAGGTVYLNYRPR